jgi:drug/metabolite transporter (DMT)-like permease
MEIPVLSLILLYLMIAPFLTMGFKYIFTELGFHFPMTTVFALLLLEWIIVVIVRMVRGHTSKAYDDDDSAVDSKAQRNCLRSKRVVAIAVGLCLSTEIACSNLSLLTLSVSFHTMVKASTPVWVLAFSCLIGFEEPNWQLGLVRLRRWGCTAYFSLAHPPTARCPRWSS